MNFWNFFFDPKSGPWFTGNIWGNMVAWVICGVIAVLWARRKLIKWDRKRKVREEERHEELKAHVTKHAEEIHRHIEKGKKYGK